MCYKSLLSTIFVVGCLSLLVGCDKSVSSSDLFSCGEMLDSVYSRCYDADSLHLVCDSLSSLDDTEFERVHVLKQLGRVLRNQSDFDGALSAHREGLVLALVMGDTVEIVRAYNNIATDYRRMGSLSDAAECHYSALQLNDMYSVRDCFATRKNRVTSLNGLGNIYLSFGNLPLADSLFRQALATERELESHVGQAINLSNIGHIFESQGQLDSALLYYECSLRENELAGSQLGIALCHINFGGLHERAGELGAAIEDYGKALELLSGGRDQWHWLQAEVSMARVRLTCGDLDVARNCLDSAWTVAKGIGSLEHQAELTCLRSELLERQGDASGALEMFRRSLVLTDSVASLQHIGNTNETRLRYEEGALRVEMDSMQRFFDTERRLMTLTIVVIALALLLALCLVGWLVVFVRWRTRQHRLLVAAYERSLESLHDQLVGLEPASGEYGSASDATVVPDSVGGASQRLVAASSGSDAAQGSATSKSQQEERGAASADSDAEFLRVFYLYIQKHLADEDLGVVKLSQFMGLTQRQFSRKVRELTQLDTQTCIRTARVREAKQLLERTELSVFDIGVRCGFDSASYFSRVFRRDVGCSPSEFRRAAQAKNS